MTDRSKQLFERANQVFPGGVNSPVRAFRSVGGTPRFIRRGSGPYLYDVDGQRYVDYILSYGPLILGHAHPEVVAAINEAAADGTSFGAPNERSLELSRADPTVHAWVGDVAFCQFRDGSNDECDSTGASFYRSRQDRQIRRVLSWSRRLLAGSGWFRSCHARSARFTRSNRPCDSGYVVGAVQRFGCR